MGRPIPLLPLVNVTAGLTRTPCARLLLTFSILAVGCRGDPAAATNNHKSSATERAIPMRESWPFSDAENTATITLKRIIDGTAPILWVSHDLDDGIWQF